MERENLKEKIKGIRLSDERLEWWGNNPEAAELVREFIDMQIKNEGHIEQIKKAPLELLEKLKNLVNNLRNKTKGTPKK